MSATAPESNLPFMKRLLAEGKSEAEIEQAFLARYTALGKTDPEWVRKRTAIYRSLATRPERPDDEGLTPERTVAVLGDLVQRGLTNERFRRLHHWGDDPVRAKRTSINIHSRYCKKTARFQPADRANRDTLRRLLHVAAHLDVVQAQGPPSVEDWDEAVAAARATYPPPELEPNPPAPFPWGMDAAVLQLKPYTATEEGRRALDAFADSIEEVHAYGPEVWGVLVSKDLKCVSLIVATLQVTAIGEDLTHDMRKDGIEPPDGPPCWVWVAIAPDQALPAPLVSALAADPDWVPRHKGYKQPSSQWGYYFASKEGAATWGHVLAAQAPFLQALIERNPKGLRPQFHALHLDGVLEFLELELKRPLPRPELPRA